MGRKMNKKAGRADFDRTTEVTWLSAMRKMAGKGDKESKRQANPRPKEFVPQYSPIVTRSRARQGNAEDVLVAVDDVFPGDSVSQTSSRASSISSSYVRVKAEAAALAVEAEGLKRRQELERQEFELRLRKEALELETQRAQKEAQAEAFAEASQVSRGSSKIKRNKVTRAVAPVADNTSPVATSNGSAVAPVAVKPPAVAENREPVVEELEVVAPSKVAEEDGHKYGFSMMQLQQQVMTAMHMPKTELMTYDGDPLKYWLFIKAFEATIEASTCEADSTSRLLRLLQYCKGKARAVIESCVCMPADVGYKRARVLLKERFGNDFTITQAWVQRIIDRPQISSRDCNELQMFADDLRSCRDTLQAMGYVGEVSTQHVMVKLVSKLPLHLRSRWLKDVQTKADKEFRAPDIHDLVSFVENAASEANHPVYGSLVANDRQPSFDSQTPQRRQRSSNTVVHNVQTSSPEARVKKPCELCGGAHSLFGCGEFKGMSVEERLKLVMDHRLCFNCLKGGHWAAICRQDRVCGIDGCEKKHARFLHAVSHPPISETDPAPVISQAISCNAIKSGRSRLALPIVPVQVRVPGSRQTFLTHALLDGGSTATFCSEELVARMGVTGTEETISLTTLEGQGSYLRTRVVGLEVAALGGGTFSSLSRVYTKSSIPVNADHIPVAEDVTRYAHLRDVRLPDVDCNSLGLLIGQDNSDLILPLEVRHGGPGLPYATRTRLGWTLNGSLGETDGKEVAVNLCNTRSLETQVERFWHVEGWECLNGPEESYSLEDKRTMQLWQDSVSQVENGHYQLPIPFRSENVRLPDSYPMALGRLKGLQKRLIRDPELHRQYVRSMDTLFEKGYAEIVNDSPNDDADSVIWYIPHHPVVTPKKVRIVFDCAAQVNGTSLNRVVMQGPDVSSGLIGVLLRFRLGPVAIMADIESMFHQVRVTPKNRDALRFLWWPDGKLGIDPKTYRMTAHLFGGTWSPACCGFALQRVADDYGGNYSEETANTIRRNFYVDDCLRAVDSVQEATALVSELRSLLAEGGFKLTKWLSNDRSVLQSIPVEDRAKAVKDLDINFDGLPSEKALGMVWKLEKDCWGFDIHLPEQTASTRRGMLSVVSSVFDPLGLLAPFTLNAKILIQDLTRKKQGWDDPLPESCRSDWEKWKGELRCLSSFQIKRCLKPRDANECQLHVFSDASQVAYGAAAYLRVVASDGTVSCTLIMSKSRLAPIKAMSIPRLELSAAALAVKLEGMLRLELDLELVETVFWTDSAVVLGYILNSRKRFHTFVANRVAAIHEGSQPSQWRHVASEVNPADDLSRGLSAPEMTCRVRWMFGPEFLLEAEEVWPASNVRPNVSDDDPEVKREGVPVQACVNLGDTDEEVGVFRLIFGFSSWHKLKRVVALFLRVKTWLKCRAVGSRPPSVSEPLAACELKVAEREIVKVVQARTFPEYLVGGEHPGKKGKLAALNPVLSEDGVLCVGGRVGNAPVSDCLKRPMLLPKKHHLVDVLVRDTHAINGHIGREHTLALLRQEFWIISGRQAVRRVLKDCVTCRRWKAPPMFQKMADLPACRVEATCAPFSNVGVDMFGPFVVKRARSHVKRYGCLFTCMTVRAVHIEVCHSLDTDSFVNALHRFMARRGCPKHIYSDNGTNFIGAEGQLKESRVRNALLKRGVQWHFNPPHAPHMGGAWERMIGTVKRVLQPMMSEQVLDDEGLGTLMCMVESIVNGRPLTAVSDDPNDLEALTVNHLLHPGFYQCEYPEDEFVKEDRYARRRWRQIQYYADVFWRRWTREYLPLLQARTKWQGVERDIRQGDIVLVVQETPRSSWPLARVLEVCPGLDGRVRSATVKSGNTELVRPITKLCLLEEAC